jgi:hypothetical protein
MKWIDISDAGEWTIAHSPREKGTGSLLVLPQAAIDIVRAQPRIGANPHVFAATRGLGPWHNWSIAKAALDARMPGVAKWQIHDLRRTARSLMSRAKVMREHAERVLGHAIAGVEGVYDRHRYRDEKAAALARLAALIEGIVHPRDNVVLLAKSE